MCFNLNALYPFRWYLRIIFSIFLTLLVYFCDANSNVSIGNLFSLVLSISSISVGIIGAFIISITYNLKNEKAKLKFEIDELSRRLYSLRALSHLWITQALFWNSFRNVKQRIDRNHAEFSIYDFRSESDENRIIAEEIGGQLVPQAYLSLKWLAGKNWMTEYYMTQTFPNYYLQELHSYLDPCYFVYRFCEEFKNEVPESAENPYWKEKMKEEALKASNDSAFTNVSTSELGRIYESFYSKVIPTLIRKTEINTYKPEELGYGMENILFFSPF